MELPKDLILSEQEVEEALAYWQDKLCLQSWRIKIQWQPKIWMDGCDANVSPSWATRSAIVRLVNPKSDGADTSGDIIPTDTEELLVHELLHILFTEVEDTLSDLCSEEKSTTEQPIEMLAIVMVAMRRTCKDSMLSFDERIK